MVLLTHTMAQQAFVVVDIGEFESAVDLVQDARREAGTKVPPRFRAWLRAAEAEVLAASSDATGSLQDDMTTQLAALRTRHAGEQEDVERLEGLSLTRVLASLRGTRDDTLERERAEADTGWPMAGLRRCGGSTTLPMSPRRRVSRRAAKPSSLTSTTWP